jgi:hypothetical protein
VTNYLYNTCRHAFNLAVSLDSNLDLSLELDLSLNSDFDIDLDIDCALELILARTLLYAQNLRDLCVFSPEIIQLIIATFKSLESEQFDQAHITEIWLNFLNIDDKISSLSEKEMNALNNYLYIYELIVCCKESAVRVSPSVWSAIESRMLTVPKKYSH